MAVAMLFGQSPPICTQPATQEYYCTRLWHRMYSKTVGSPLSLRIPHEGWARAGSTETTAAWFPPACHAGKVLRSKSPWHKELLTAEASSLRSTQ